MRLALAAVALLATSPAGASERPPKAHYDPWLNDTMVCRDGGGSQAATDAACEHRNVVDREMAAAGWCFGRAGEDGVHMQWHRCGR